jgi:hypothetical protein
MVEVTPKWIVTIVKHETQTRAKEIEMRMRSVRIIFGGITAMLLFGTSLCLMNVQAQLIILAPGALPAQEPVVVNTDLVTIRATVTDAKGNYVLGLEKTAFTIQDDDLPQKITAFSDEDTPVSVAVVFDVRKGFRW